jgi:hypothetical protein
LLFKSQIKLAENNLTKDTNIVVPKQTETLAIKPIVTPRSHPQPQEQQPKFAEKPPPNNTSFIKPLNINNSP